MKGMKFLTSETSSQDTWLLEAWKKIFCHILLLRNKGKMFWNSLYKSGTSFSSWEVVNQGLGDEEGAPLLHGTDVLWGGVVVHLSSCYQRCVTLVGWGYPVFNCQNMSHVEVVTLVIKASIVPLIYHFTCKMLCYTILLGSDWIFL